MKQLPQLIQQLNYEVRTKKIENVLELLDTFEAYTGDDWVNYLATQKDDFKYKILYKDEHFKLILIRWNGYRQSQKHGHASGGGLMKLLKGALVETRFCAENEDDILGKFEYTTGQLSYIHDELATHVVENPTAEPAISLHLYALGNKDFNNTFTNNISRAKTNNAA